MASAIGVTCSLHYCGTHFRELCFTADTEKNCCGEFEKPGCCHDDVIKVKVSDSHAPAHLHFNCDNWQHIIPANLLLFKQYTCRLPMIVRVAYAACDTSPPGEGPPVYLLHRNIRI